ncbi:VPLPA-CTERM sorting domain-containing protein [Oceanicoccus sagamiensis]|uniref:Ice-binding protein C-terminal domain-containing protein n=1 Tax=Oceanicoccus sagamiensis TaxID=716816 RepID=A0A1X9NM33_9GAMM|nr:VPLPA-CTERM sorting domain-containing protein [Oceanicoccus sagamiensis]ARN75877.1 hypothetical protein BST96_18265 [Oceanicoccus sagamiensis]
MKNFLFVSVFSALLISPLIASAGGHDESGGGDGSEGGGDLGTVYNIIGESRVVGRTATFVNDTTTIVGEGQVIGDSFTYTVVNTVNSLVGTADIFVDGDISLSSGAGLEVVTACEGETLICSSVSLNIPSALAFDSIVDTVPGTFVLRDYDLFDLGDGLGFADADLVMSATLASLPQEALPALPSIAVVPVPAALWLFGSGLLGLAAIKRRQ